MMLWIALVVVGILVCIFTEVERWTLATISLIVTGVATFYMSGTHPVTWFTDNWQGILLYAGVYIVIGILWSFIKWFSFLMAFRDKYREMKEAWMKRNGLNPIGQIPDELKPEFQAWLKESHSYYKRNTWYYDNPLNKKPSASDNKQRIVAWMSFWPFSLISTFLNDPIRRAFNFCFSQLKATYQKMSDHVFRNDQELN